MSIVDNLRGKLPRWFQTSATQSAGVEKAGPDYFLTPEHVEAIQTIIKLRKDSIVKQGKSFDDLASDVGIFQYALFGENDIRDNKEPKTHMEEICEGLKSLSVEDKKQFLQQVYNAFNNGPLDEKPAYAKWVTKGNVEFEKIMLRVNEYNEMLSRHSLKIVGKHKMKDPNSERSAHIRDIVNLVGNTARFTSSMRKARMELDVGFGRLFTLTTDAANIAPFDGEEFERAFDEYIDALPDRIMRIKLSHATAERKQEWAQKLDDAEDLLGQVIERQSAVNYEPEAPAPEVS